MINSVKIAFPLLNLHKSGGVRIAVQYCNELKKNGTNSILYVPCGGDSKIEYEVPSEIEIRRFKVNALLRKPFGYFSMIPFYFSNFNKNNLVIATSWQIAFLMILSFHPLSKIILLIQHDDDIILGDSQSISTWIKKKLFRIVYSLPIRKFCVSEWLKFHLKGKYRIDTTCISNGTDINAFIGLEPLCWTPPSNSFDILCIYRNVNWKGFDDFVCAANFAYEKIPNLRVIVVTNETIVPRQELFYAPLIVKKPKNDKELGLIYRESSLFIFPSWIEGFGLPPLECMANGLPVISTQCGGVMDYMIDNYNAILVDVNSPDQISEAILKLYLNNDILINLSKNGLATASNLSMKNVVAKFQHQISDVL